MFGFISKFCFLKGRDLDVVLLHVVEKLVDLVANAIDVVLQNLQVGTSRSMNNRRG